jgi:hypothetical protein
MWRCSLYHPPWTYIGRANGPEEYIQLYIVGIQLTWQLSTMEIYKEHTERLFSAIEDVKADMEEIVCREMMRPAANSQARFPVCPEMDLRCLARSPLKQNVRSSNNHGDFYRSVQDIHLRRSPSNWVKSHELKGGVLYSKCDCTRRNGLQSDCGRFLCMGRPDCLTEPPMCIPSRGLGYISHWDRVCDTPCWTWLGIRFRFCAATKPSVLRHNNISGSNIRKKENEGRKYTWFVICIPQNISL